MTNKLEQLKKKLEEAQIAHNAAFSALAAARDVSDAAYDAACDAYAAAFAAALDAREAYYQELNKNNE